MISSSRTEAIVEGNKPGSLPPRYVGGITEAGVQNMTQILARAAMPAGVWRGRMMSRS